MTTPFYSRELSFLQKAQSRLLTSTGCLFPMNDQNYASCDPSYIEPLMKFRDSWSHQTKTHQSRVEFLRTIRWVFGDLDDELGALPVLVVVSILIVICWISWEFYKRWKRDILRRFDTQKTFLNICITVIVALVALPLLWTYGIIARYENIRLDVSLKRDSSSVDGNNGITYNSVDFGRIWNACKSSALRQLYNCHQGFAVNKDIDVTDDIKDATCVGSRPSMLSADRTALYTGLETLRSVNLSDFDPVSLLQFINRGVLTVRGYLEPMIDSSQLLTAEAAKQVVMTKIVPILKRPDFVPSQLPETSDPVPALFQQYLSNEKLPELYTIVSDNWPSVKPDVFMEDVDAVLEAFYDVNVEGYYTTTLRDTVLMTFRYLVDKLTTETQATSGRFTTLIHFKKVNWALITTRQSQIQGILSSLADKVDKYTMTFASIHKVTDTLSSVLAKLYIDCSLGIIVIGLLIFLVYYLGISRFDQTRESMTNGDRLYPIMDIAKYVTIGVTVAMFIMAILVAVKKKMQKRGEHNANALYYNTMRLREAALALKARPFEPIGFYDSAVQLVEAYESCNFVTQNVKVPFPTIEFCIYAIFVAVCVGALLFLTTMVDPVSNMKTIRDFLDLREKLRLFSAGTLPSSLQSELNNRIRCIDETGSDTLRVLSFVFVVVMFILNCIMVANFSSSTELYTAALDTLAADVCV